MTIPSVAATLRYNGDGADIEFPYTWKILDDDDIKVYLRVTATGVETLQTKDTHYTVDGVGEDGGGNVTFITTPTDYTPGATEEVILKRRPSIIQQTDYKEGDEFSPESHEDALDLLTMISQMIDEKIARALLLLETSSYSGLTLPDPVADKYLQWKNDLSGLQNVSLIAASVGVSAFMETHLDDADDDTALKTLCLQQVIVEITDTAGGNVLDVAGESTGCYNGESWTKVEDIAENTPKGGITLATGGSYIQIDSDTLLTGDALVVLAAEVVRNDSTTQLICRPHVSDGNIYLTFLSSVHPGTVVDLGTIVDQESGEVSVKVTYITDE